MLTTLTVTSLSDDTLANLAGDGQLSLREAVEAANLDMPVGDSPAGSGADTIEFAPGLAGGTITLAGTELAITEDLTISGLGADQLTISGGNASRVFSVDAGVTAEISDVTVADGYAIEGGGIYSSGLLSIENSALIGNSSDDQGGGIWSDGTLDITHSTITENESVWYQGGGIWSDGTANITDSTFSSNSSYDDGGGIWSIGTLNITDSTFSDNTTTGDWGSGLWGGRSGGAIWNGGALDITHGSFSNNSAVRHGGGIHNVGGTVAITDSQFTGNSADGSGATGGAFSSFVHLTGSDGTLEITRSTFTGNSASTGAAIWNDMPASIADSTFLDNTAGSGGAISNRVRTMTVTNTTLANNSSRAYGGALDLWGGTLVLRDSTVSGNSAKRDGGAIENYFATVKLFNSTVSGNSAGGLGGAIDNWGGTVESTNSTIVMNRADADGNGSETGGGIYNLNASSVALLNNTLLAGNLLGVAGSDSPNDLAGADVDLASSHNLIGDTATSGGLTDGANGNIVGDNGGTIDIATVIDVNLTDNGGPTLTHALVAGGLAVDAGDNSLAVDANGNSLDTDQRGDGFARIYGGTVDIGAFEDQPQTVQIDVKPGSDPNSINLASNGMIAVAIFTTDDFDATTVDSDTVSFAGADAVHSALEDVDGDGDLDMVLHFRVQDTTLADLYAQLLVDDHDADGILDSNRQTAAVSLTGETLAGEAILGTDEVDLFFSGKALRDLLDQLF
ncbi:choice-of-anchor Q domain-containing protein [Planctomycetota bacterium]